ncbi:hypothetical protein GCM10011581_38440 [Saccharopolyspora subtropica]|uniref:Uncharacterized protein n=1 Tax=Saccharopolyspora thermophila TaxID=89367 RepID=A0A917NH40_9PSEU|nr:hypothetical protein [Saccharopolyspora subtropica]GGI97599.1 hypothetical protein GCM10011581_38440 [Saccharopolyspora subtropica]
MRLVERMRDDQLVEELRLLLDAAAGKAEEYLRGCAQQGEAVRAGCGWCPVCAAVGLLRGQHPELKEHLVGVVQALRALLADHQTESEEDTEDEPVPAKVQHIGVQRVAGRVLDETEATSRC